MTQNITTILFDFGGVLVDLDKRLCLDEFAKIGVFKIEELISKFTQSGLFLAFEKGEISVEEFRAEIKKMTDNKISDKEIDAAWNSFLLGIPEYKLNMLLQLKKKYRVLMLSNTNAIHFEQVAPREFGKEGLKISDYFHKCYLSYKLGMAKPDDDIFHHIIENEEAKPENILFLDDGAKNIETAKKLGFSTYLVKEKEDFRHIFN